MNDDILSKYIERISLLSDRDSAEMDEATLRQIALDVGLSEEDLAHAEVVAQNHHVRGNNYLRHQRVDDAITEFNEALALAPGNDKIRLDLARAYVAGYQKTGHPDWKEYAEILLRQCLEEQPSLDAAYALLNDLQSNLQSSHKRVKKNRRTLLLSAVAGAAIFVIMIAGVGFFLISTPAPARPTEPASQPATTPLGTLQDPITDPPTSDPDQEQR